MVATDTKTMQTRVVILCGGLGTRLREETEFRPKPLVEIGGRPILWHIMKIFAHHGLKDFTLCLGYKGNLIKEYFLNYEAINNNLVVHLGARSAISYLGEHEEQDYTVRLIDTGGNAQTGARVKKVERLLEGDRFIVTYGDGLTDVDVPALLEFHRSHGKLATVTTARTPGRFGAVELSPGNQVLRFREKPMQDSWISAGFFVFERQVLSYLTAADGCTLEREPLETLAREGQLMAYRHPGEFFPMDTYRDHVALNDLWNSGKAPWKIW
jgi:glucose-1-phosphate cytidylyltransferase